MSGRQQKTLLQELQDAAEKTVSGPLLKETKGSFEISLEQEFGLCVDPNDTQTLLFTYPTFEKVGTATDYVQPVIRLEFGARGVNIPAEECKISPYLHQAYPSLLGKPEIKAILLGIERTFWEKVTILHMLFHQPATKPLADRMSRHFYDMAMLIDHEAKSRAIGKLELLEQVAHHKSVFFKAAWASYDTAKPGTLRLLPNSEVEGSLRKDYTGMREMIFGDVPDFDDILAKIGTLETEINS